MSENENGTVVEKARTSRLAIWSFGLVVIFILAAFFIFVFKPNILFIFVCLICVPLGIVFGITSIFKIRKSKGQLKGMGFAIGGLTIHLILSIVIIYGIVELVSIAGRFICYDKLSMLGKSLKFYSEDNRGLYPPADKWCDVLKSEEKIPEKIFACPSGNTKKGLCDYAMNPDVEPNSSGDVVLLFETKEGWNQHGGPELLITERHGKLKGCNVLFNDGGMRFVEQKDFGKLKWKDEKVVTNEWQGEKK